MVFWKIQGQWYDFHAKLPTVGQKQTLTHLWMLIADVAVLGCHSFVNKVRSLIC